MGSETSAACSLGTGSAAAGGITGLNPSASSDDGGACEEQSTLSAVYRRVAGAGIPHTHGSTHLWDALAGIFLILRLRRTTAHGKAYTALRSRNYKDFSCRMYVPRNPRVVFLDQFRHQKSRPQRPIYTAILRSFVTVPVHSMFPQMFPCVPRSFSTCFLLLFFSLVLCSEDNC